MVDGAVPSPLRDSLFRSGTDATIHLGYVAVVSSPLPPTRIPSPRSRSRRRPPPPTLLPRRQTTGVTFTCATTWATRESSGTSFSSSSLGPTDW